MALTCNCLWELGRFRYFRETSQVLPVGSWTLLTFLNSPWTAHPRALLSEPIPSSHCHQSQRQRYLHMRADCVPLLKSPYSEESPRAGSHEVFGEGTFNFYSSHHRYHLSLIHSLHLIPRLCFLDQHALPGSSGFFRRFLSPSCPWAYIGQNQ